MLGSVVAFTMIFILWLWTTTRRPKNFPPGPKWLPIVGNIPLLVKKLSALGFHHLVWDDLVKTYGSIVGLKLGKQKVVLVSGTELIKEVSMRDEFAGRPDGFFWRLRGFWQRLGLVFTDGEIWAEQRRFSVQQLKKFGFGRSKMEELIIEEASALVKWLNDRSGEAIEMSQVFNISVLNIIWAMIAGKRYSREDKTLIKVCDTIHESFRLLDASGGILQHIPAIRFIAPDLSGYTAMVDIHKILYGFLNKTIAEHKNTIQPGVDRDFIDAFLHKMEADEARQSTTYIDDQLRVLCLDFLQAGTDTTSNTLAFLILFMINYPRIQRKMQAEIDTAIGKNRMPALEDRTEMPYTSAVILEVQRMASIAPAGIPHRVCRTTTLSNYTIPEDTTVLLLMHNMHMDESWNDPHNFRPERFLNEHGKLLQNDEVGAFGFGKRKCIGENLAKSNIFLFCTFLFQYFNVSKEKGASQEPKIEKVNGISLTPKPYKAIWSRRT